MAPIIRRNGPGETPRARHRAAIRPASDLADVLRLKALGPLGDVEFHGVTLGQAPETIGLDRREVDEDVRTRLLRDEAEALRVVEPLHFTLCHTVLTLCTKGLPPRIRCGPGHRDQGRAQTKTASR